MVNRKLKEEKTGGVLRGGHGAVPAGAWGPAPQHEAETRASRQHEECDGAMAPGVLDQNSALKALI